MTDKLSKKEWKPFVIRQSSIIDDGTKSIWFGKCEISCGNPPALVSGEANDLNCEIRQIAVPREPIEKAVAFLESKEVYDKVARHNSLLILLAALKQK